MAVILGNSRAHPASRLSFCFDGLGERLRTPALIRLHTFLSCQTQTRITCEDLLGNYNGVPGLQSYVLFRILSAKNTTVVDGQFLLLTIDLS